MLELEKACPRIFALHGAASEYLDGMEPGPARDALAELVGIMELHGLGLVRRGDAVLMTWPDGWDEEHAAQLERAGELLKLYPDAALRWIGPHLEREE